LDRFKAAMVALLVLAAFALLLAALAVVVVVLLVLANALAETGAARLLQVLVRALVKPLSLHCHTSAHIQWCSLALHCAVLHGGICTEGIFDTRWLVMFAAMLAYARVGASIVHLSSMGRSTCTLAPPTLEALDLQQHAGSIESGYAHAPFATAAAAERTDELTAGAIIGLFGVLVSALWRKEGRAKERQRQRRVCAKQRRKRERQRKKKHYD